MKKFLILFTTTCIFMQNAYAAPNIPEGNFKTCLDKVYKDFKNSIVLQIDILNDQYLKNNDLNGAGEFIKKNLNKVFPYSFSFNCNQFDLAFIEKYLADNKLSSIDVNLKISKSDPDVTSRAKLDKNVSILIPVSKATFVKQMYPKFLIIYSSSIKNYKINDVIGKDVIYNNGSNQTDESIPYYIKEECTKVMEKSYSNSNYAISNRSPDLLFYHSVGTQSVSIPYLSNNYDTAMTKAKEVFKKVQESSSCSGVRAYLAVASISTSNYNGVYEDIEKLVILDNLGYK